MKRRQSIARGKVKAWTLTEILVVLVIIGILILLVLPSFLPLITRAKTLEAKGQLEHLQMLEKTYFYEHSKYSPSLEDISFEQKKLVTEGSDGKANYKIEIIHASNGDFKARATAVVDFDGDGKFNVWEVDQDMNLKEVTPD